MHIELLRDAHAVIGESPTWVANEGAIFWIDIKAPALHRLGFPDKPDHSWPLPEDVGAFALIADTDNQIAAAIVALRSGLFRLDLSTERLQLVAAAPFDSSLTRFNEGASDSRGRFWVGSMFDPLSGETSEPVKASLYSYKSSTGLRHEPDAAELHNGMAWNADETIFYFSHSQRREIFSHAFDVATGQLGNRKSFALIDENLGVPDGAAVDVDGCYWCALHGASRLHRYRPDGRLDREIMLPVSQPTMCAFVGENLDTMVVTSASDKLDTKALSEQPHAGGVFCFQPGIQGLPRRYLVC